MRTALGRGRARAEPLAVLGIPGGERVAAFQAALCRLGRRPAPVISWEDFLISRRLELPGGALLRIESPGEDARVERLLIARGAEEPDERFDAPRIAAREALALPDEPGRILYPRQLHLGFRAALREIGYPAMNPPSDLAVLRDKPSCHEVLAAAGVPRPRVLGYPRSFDELREITRASPRVFVKLANGSSASGVVAYQTSRGRHLAVTTVELAGNSGEDRLYNSRRPRRYTAVARLFDALCPQGVLVEEWIPKATFGGRAFDLRAVVIDGRARQVVARTSRSPLTNLHLGGGNRRADPERLRAALGEDLWQQALATAESALAAFPQTLYGGVDLLVRADRRRVLVAEVNGFGDLLHRATRIHELEIGAALARGGRR